MFKVHTNYHQQSITSFKNSKINGANYPFYLLQFKEHLKTPPKNINNISYNLF